MSKNNALPLSSLELVVMSNYHSIAEIGAITVMLAYVWRCGPEGAPDDDKVMARVMKCGKTKWINTLRPVVARHFNIADGRWSIPLDSPLLVSERRLSWPEWTELRSQVFERDSYTCVYCGKKGGRLECDHVVPISRGGSNDLKNLATACHECNRDKRDKTPQEWRPA